VNKLINKIIHYPKIGLVILAYIAFIALGMPDGLLGVAWPSIRSGFSISLDAIGMLLPFTTAGYVTSAFLSGPLMSRLGVGKVLALSCTLTGLALIGYTLVPAWIMMVFLGLFAGLGAGAIDAGLNSYVAANYGEGLMQWLHASYGIGVTFGPLIMTYTLSVLDSWRIGYRIVGGFQLLLAVIFFSTLPMWNDNKTESEQAEKETNPNVNKPAMRETLRQPMVWLGAFLFFLYVGAEISLGTWAYSLLTESRGIAPTTAGLVTGSFWATFTIGRIIAGIFAKKLGVHRLFQSSILLALFGTLLLIWNPIPVTNLIAVAIIGFAIAPVFPALMSGTSQRVGEQNAANTIGLQMASTGLGGALIPSLMGILARQFSLEIIPICLVIVFISLFGFYQISLINLNKVQVKQI